MIPKLFFCVFSDICSTTEYKTWVPRHSEASIIWPDCKFEHFCSSNYSSVKWTVILSVLFCADVKFEELFGVSYCSISIFYAHKKAEWKRQKIDSTSIAQKFLSWREVFLTLAKKSWSANLCFNGRFPPCMTRSVNANKPSLFAPNQLMETRDSWLFLQHFNYGCTIWGKCAITLLNVAITILLALNVQILKCANFCLSAAKILI